MSILMPQMACQQGTHCLLASLRMMLEMGLKLKISEAELYFRCGGLQVEHDPLENPYRIGRSGEAMLQHFNEYSGILLQYSFRLDDWSTKQHLLNDINRQLHSSKPIMLFVNSQCLSYRPINPDNPSHPHVVVLYGMDEANDIAHIADSFLLDEAGHVHTFQGQMSLQELIDGAFGICWLKYGKSNAFSDGQGMNDERELMQVVKEQISSFLVSGLQSYYAFFDRLEEAVAMDKPSFVSMCKEVYYCLRIGSMMHQLSYLMDIVQQVPNYFREKGSEHWKGQWQIEHENWKKHLFSIFKAGLRGNQASWPPILKHSRLLLDKQRDLVNEMILDWQT